MFNSCFS